MSHFGLKISKTESPDKTPYTVYYPHDRPSTERKWTQPYLQFISIDPARKNYAFRIERRYQNGWITPVVFDKVAIEASEQNGDTMICNTYKVLTSFFDKYQEFYDDCHFLIIERQLPQNYKATRIAQHSISYFSLVLRNRPLLPAIVEIDPKLKGKILGAPKNISDKQLKSWAVEKSRELLTIRKDDFSLGVMNHFRNKQDDLGDIVIQIEAMCILWGLPATSPPPLTGPDNTILQVIRPMTLQMIPTPVIPDLNNIDALIQPINNLTIQKPISKNSEPNPRLFKMPTIATQQDQILSLVKTAPARPQNPTYNPAPISLVVRKPMIPVMLNTGAPNKQLTLSLQTK